MTSALEREIKLLLPDEAAWRRLRAALGQPVAVHRQVNTYFDTPDGRLRRSRALMVRIRDEDGRFEVTAKDRGARQEGVRSARERSEPLDAGDVADVLGGRRPLTSLDVPLCRTLAAEAGGPLGPIGATVNIREVYPLQGGYVAEVDRTEFPGGRVDHEVEIELREPHHTADGARAAIAGALLEAGVPDPSPARGKYARFLESVGR